MLRRPTPPLWFWALLGMGTIIVLLRTGAYDAPAPPVSLAFWAFLVAIGQAIWTVVQIVGQSIVHILIVSVNALWAFARTVWLGLRELGSAVLHGLRLGVWKLMQLYEHVLEPAWRKFWSFIDWTRTALDKVFRPVFRVLLRIRAELLKFYTRWVRPILDTIDVARKVLRVFSTLGLEWAKKLDAKLAQIAEHIDAPFRLLLRKLNEVINLVNRVVTADGLFQRLALVRSIERDIAFVSRAWWRANVRPLTADERAALALKGEPVPIEEHVRDVRAAIIDDSGPLAAKAREAVQDVKLMIDRARAA